MKRRLIDTFWVSTWALLLATLLWASPVRATAPYSIDTYTSSGGATYSVTFPYLQKGDVRVYVNGVLKVSGTDYTWTTGSTITFGAAPSAGASVVISRATSVASPDVVYSGGALRAADLNLANTQAIYALQEFSDFASQASAQPPGALYPLKANNGSDFASLPGVRHTLNITSTTSLEDEATAHGLVIGKADDGDVFTAANADILAASTTGGLTVMLPLNLPVKTSTHLVLSTNGGYACPQIGQCFVTALRANGDATSNYFVTLSDAYVVNPVLWGFTLYGGTPAYGGSTPAAWLDTQGGVDLEWAGSGISDSTYVARSFVGAQLPDSNVGYMTIGGFGGTCMKVAGAGGSVFGPLRFRGCQGQMLNVGGYDSKFESVDGGASGRTGLWSQGASENFGAIKMWFTGQRNISGDNYGAAIVNTAGNQMPNLFIQDAGGTALFMDNTLDNQINAHLEWQGGGATGSVTCALQLAGSAHNQINMVADIAPYGGSFPNATHLVCDTPAITTPGTTFSTYNVLHITAQGWPNDFGTPQDSWLYGPLDNSNHYDINGASEVPQRWLEDQYGNLNFGSQANGSLIGLAINGPHTSNPGQAFLLSQSPGVVGIGAFANSAVAASDVVTFSANPSNNDTLTVGGTVYTYKTTLTGAPNEIHIGATKAATILNTHHALNAANPEYITGYITATLLGVTGVQRGVIHVGDQLVSVSPGLVTAGTTITATGPGSGGEGFSGFGFNGNYTVGTSQTVASGTVMMAIPGVIGTDYGYGTIPNGYVTATDNGSTTVTVTALYAGVAGNSITMAKSSSAISLASSTLTGGSAGTQTYTYGFQTSAIGQPMSPSMAGPYANDTAAAAASPAVPVGGLYYDSSNIVHRRAS